MVNVIRYFSACLESRGGREHGAASQRPNTVQTCDIYIELDVINSLTQSFSHTLACQIRAADSYATFEEILKLARGTENPELCPKVKHYPSSLLGLPAVKSIRRSTCDPPFFQ